MIEPSKVLHLPISTVLGELLAVLSRCTRVALCAPTGSGKTSGVPLILAEQAWNTNKRIVLLQPRRVAARMAAAHMAEMLHESVGERIGYQVRFDRRISKSTQIEVLTEGIYLRRLQRDPELHGVGAVIFDEYHERNLTTDLALAMSLDTQAGLAPELRIILMSATLDAQNLGTLANKFRLVQGEGRAHPVQIEYRAPESRGNYLTASAGAARSALREGSRGSLVFLPGRREIEAVHKQLLAAPELRAGSNVRLHRLHGERSPQAQDAAVRPEPDGAVKLVLATNIAETSLTIDQIDVVIDSGLERRPRLDKGSGLMRLDTVPISQASADQRSGRAGRQAPGSAIRLWSEHGHSARPAHIVPEILDCELSAFVLELAQWGVLDVYDLQWPDPPPRSGVKQAQVLLQMLGALDGDGGLTAIGRQMTMLPVHPRIARLLVHASNLGERELGCAIAAIIEEGDPISSSLGADITLRLDRLLEALHTKRESRVLARHLRAFEQLYGLMGTDEISALVGSEMGVEEAQENLSTGYGSRAPQAPHSHPLAIHADATAELLLSAYPDRLAQRRSRARTHYRLVSGRGVRLSDDDPLAGAEYLLVANAQMNGRDGFVRLAAKIDEAQIRSVLAGRIKTRQSIHWVRDTASVQCETVCSIGAVILERDILTDPDPQKVTTALISGIRQAGAASIGLDSTGNDMNGFLIRLRCLRRWCPALDLPDWSDSALMSSLDVWLAPYLNGVRRLEAVKELPPLQCLMHTLSHRQKTSVDEGAPAMLRLPGIGFRALEYREHGAPILSVKLQEMFGCIQTPCVAWGEIPILIHLLSPAGRPLQITQDLAGFWRGSYHEVRKAMRGRYPKHDWPEDPVTAQPHGGVKRRH